MANSAAGITTVPATRAEWTDLENLFGPRGACGGCWCMWWRLPHREYESNKGEGNRKLLESRVEEGPPPGVLAYRAGRPVGWCAIAPREEFLRLRKSRLFQPIDDQPVWSIICLFVADGERGRGVGEELIRGALSLAASLGAQVVEAYAVEPSKPTAPVFLSCGLARVYRKVGFETIQRPSATRHLMRIEVPTR